MTAAVAPSPSQPARKTVPQPQPMRRADLRQRFAKTADTRITTLMRVFTVVAAILLARIGQIVVTGFIGSPTTAQPLMLERADIVDRNGVTLAQTIPVHSIRSVRSNLMHDPRVLAQKLAVIFPDTSADEFYRRLTARESTVIRRRATPEQLNRVNELAEIGFEYPMEPDRLYPQGSMAAHVLGFVAPGRGGAMGIERSFNDQLTGSARSDKPVMLSLDARVQAALDLELSQAVTALEAKGGAGLVLDVDTGEVLAMSSMPTFDPNRVQFASADAQWNTVTFTGYELGSTFKPITVAAAMDAGVVTDLSRRYPSGPLHIDGHTIRDLHSSGGSMNVPQALVRSSNVVTAQVADRLGKDRLQATFRALEFDRRPRIELPERGLPLWPKSWGRTTTMTAGFGHSIQVTPLHLASAYAALVNGGIFRPATLMKVEPGDALPQGRRVFSEATSARMRQLLRMIVASGTGGRADAVGYRVGGKTGSAERVIDGRYARNSVVATFAGVFPMDRPRYVVLVMIDRPPGNAYSSGQRTAGFTAAPVVKKVVERIGPMLGIYPDSNHDVDISDLEPLL